MKFETPSVLDSDPFAKEEITNGQNERLEKIKYLENIFETKKTNPFGTNNIEIFKDKLKTMDYADAQNMCMRVGLNWADSINVLKKNLLRAFSADRKERQSMMPIPRAVTPSLDVNNPEHRKLMVQLGMKI